MKRTKKKQKKTLGIALAGGGARGFVHIGIFQALEEANITIDAITGTSMGAILGAAYSLGMSPKMIEKKAINFSKSKLIRLRNLNLFHESLIKPDQILKTLKALVGNHEFKDCKIPFQTIATDIESGKQVVLKTGKLLQAIQASSAIPFVFPPVFLNKRILVDGGLVDNIPIDLLEAMKTDIKIAIDINNFASRQDLAGAIFEHYYAPKYNNLLKPHHFLRRIKNNMHLMMDIILRSFEITTESASKMRLKNSKVDLLIQPDIEIGLMHFEKAEEAIQQGKTLMKKYIPEILTMLNK